MGLKMKSYDFGCAVLGASGDMDTAFTVSRQVNKGLGGIINAIVPGLGGAASGITEMWLDPLQKEVTHKPVVKEPTDAEKKAAADKDKAAADKKDADKLAAAQKILATPGAGGASGVSVPVPQTKSSSPLKPWLIGGGVVAGGAAVLVVVKLLTRRA
jgi:hypothetical protein